MIKMNKFNQGLSESNPNKNKQKRYPPDCTAIDNNIAMESKISLVDVFISNVFSRFIHSPRQSFVK